HPSFSTPAAPTALSPPSLHDALPILRRPAGDRGRRPRPRHQPRGAGGPGGGTGEPHRRRLPGRPHVLVGRPRPGPAHPDLGRVPAVRLPALAVGLRRVRVRRRQLARIPPGRLPPGPARLRRPGTPVREVAATNPPWRSDGGTGGGSDQAAGRADPIRPAAPRGPAGRRRPAT